QVEVGFAAQESEMTCAADTGYDAANARACGQEKLVADRHRLGGYGDKAITISRQRRADVSEKLQVHLSALNDLAWFRLRKRSCKRQKRNGEQQSNCNFH